jgi:hypothetical protein
VVVVGCCCCGAGSSSPGASSPASQCLQRVTLVVLSTFTGAVLLHSPWWIFPPTQPTARLHPLAAYRPATSLHLYLRPVFLLFVSFICRCVPEKTTRGLRVSFLLFNSFSRFIHYWNQRVSLEVKSRPYSRENQCERKLSFFSALVQIEFRLPLLKKAPFKFSSSSGGEVIVLADVSHRRLCKL